MAGGEEDRDLVLLAVEADVLARDVVDHERVHALGDELLARPGERQAHAPRGAVADETHAVDRLARATGGDEHLDPLPAAAGIPGPSRSAAAGGLRRRRLAGRKQVGGLRQAPDALLAARGEA